MRQMTRKVDPQRGAHVALALGNALDSVTLTLRQGEIESVCGGANLIELRFLETVADNLARLYGMLERKRQQARRRPRRPR